ncbi:uncharacterized protein RJT21DRAFT_142140 [Scheffersomyces amazonensis]|uniref:uncharacterized protein n=1 Tax=Scheffersomyces amazonensis TaxID=1078765 RepID=UPI00315D66E8
MNCSAGYAFCIFKANTRKNRFATCLRSTIQPPKPTSNLESLPDEILVQIIDHLNQFDILSLCIVNSRFYSLCMNKLFKRALLIACPSLDKPKFHRKLNTFIHTNFTIIHPDIDLKFFNSRVRKQFQVVVEVGSLPKQIKDAHYMKIHQLEEPNLLCISNLKYRMLQIDIDSHRNIQGYINAINRNRNTICFFKQLKFGCSENLPIEILEQLQGIFNGVNSLWLAYFRFHEQVLSLFQCENIKELQLSLAFGDDYIRFLPLIIKSMPNLKTLVINLVNIKFPIKALEQLSKCSLQKFCLDDSVFASLEKVKHNCNLIKTVFNYCGSSLELVKINLIIFSEHSTTLSTIDLFYISEYYDRHNSREMKQEIKQEIKDLVLWIKRNIRFYPKLQYFTFYNYSFVIDRSVEPCQWIEISSKEL